MDEGLLADEDELTPPGIELVSFPDHGQDCSWPRGHHEEAWASLHATIAAGTQYLVRVFTALWWDRVGLRVAGSGAVRARYRCVVDTPAMAVFDLSAPA